ncbi:hypothetical protein NP493_48g04004 [Ridgeia piscesae]|uniref:AB hydrolase-1 domain-containing protein n=1 Tax=Ridgeia piscesae TaxID=27915 RepID=A0AAD9PBK1_RIDPI|nr:hypothetical protein NP493_48g04004 [Ridgeia piscesae]
MLNHAVERVLQAYNDAVASLFLLAVVVCVLYLTTRVFHLTSKTTAPELFYCESDVNKKIIDACPLLKKVYKPPPLWGKSGHIQTILYGTMGRINSPFPSGVRHSIIMSDKATLTFDIFEPENPHPDGEDCTLLVCPGIANSSESMYIRTCVHYAQSQGFRVAVLNHLGALKDVPLTSPRCFTYGNTEEYGLMLDKVAQLYPDSVPIAVGFSMGGNIILKYLGENKEHQTKVLCALCCCTGFDIALISASAQPFLRTWEHLRPMYIWAMTQHQQILLRAHRDMVFGHEAKEQFGEFDEEKIFAATTMIEIDELYSRRRAGFSSVYKYYEWASSVHYMHNIEIPMMILNTEDDPIVPKELLDPAYKIASSRRDVIFAKTQHGGHLGFFEGGLVYPDTITWLDKIVVQYANAALKTYRRSKLSAK